MESDIVRPDPTSWVRVLTYNGCKFVTGLYWHPLSSPRQFMKEARAYGKQQGLDIVAIREAPTKIQAGFVSKKLGAVKGMYSMATALAGQFDSDFVACWKIDEDCYAIAGTSEGAIIPGGDLVTTLADAKQRILALQNRGLLKGVQLFVPEGFGFDVRPFDIEALLTPRRLRNEYKLRQLTFGLSRKELVNLGLLASAIIGAGVGYQMWQSHQEEIARQAAIEAERQRLAELAAKNAQAKSPLDLAALEHPWASMPDTQDLLKACSKAERVLPLSIAGWQFESAKCDGLALAATYQRSGTSTARQFTEATAVLFEEAPAFLIDNGNTVGVRVPLKVAIGRNEALPAQDLVLKEVSSHFYQQGVEPHLAPIQAEQIQPLPGNEQQPQPTLTPPWKKFSFRAETTLPPALALEGLPDTGVRTTLIETTLKNGQLTWSVAGEIYAKPQ
ncbi:type 4b pilus protein PilO2 [Pseudomonas sp. PIC25]|uniref:type 4b pilus protein PilO2 n=1 Tax=Pseudomonas sp. PIC25 TaxID=1958773 RepID=UPI000BABB76F|nr:type 4b pilus protein PilO2 [Pseudomonas sp. PIC25]